MIFVSCVISIRWGIMLVYFPNTARRNNLAVSLPQLPMLPHDILPVCCMPHLFIVIHWCKHIRVCKASYDSGQIVRIHTDVLEWSCYASAKPFFFATCPFFVSRHFHTVPTNTKWRCWVYWSSRWLMGSIILHNCNQICQMKSSWHKPPLCYFKQGLMVQSLEHYLHLHKNYV